MNKIIVLFLTLAPIVCYAADTMCVKPTTTVVVLDPNINGTALANNDTGKTWSTRFPYGIISGVGGCYANVGSSTQGVVASDQTNITPYSTGNVCYCKMLRPIESPWVCSDEEPYNSTVKCAGNCASYCSSRAASVVAVRVGMFGNVVE
jgi:hypothetical protein